MRNLITDVAGVRVGHADDARLGSGVTAIVFDEPATASFDLRGGAPGTRETALLDPAQTISGVDAIALSGGSAFGLDAATGVQAFLREQGRGFAVRDVRVPIVPAAILFDLANGGDKKWGRYSPYRELGYDAAVNAGVDFALGSAGAGFGANTRNLKGGLGSASAVVDGVTVGALAAVNALGRVTVGDSKHFWAAPFEQGEEFGGVGMPASIPPEALEPQVNRPAGVSTTLVVVATDVTLTKPEAKRLAMMAQTGMARAIYPAHTEFDGDLVFAAATGKKLLPATPRALSQLGAIAANVTSRAIARAIYEATALPFAGAMPTWKDKFGR